MPSGDDPGSYRRSGVPTRINIIAAKYSVIGGTGQPSSGPPLLLVPPPLSDLPEAYI
jgi:hypothetical protein